MSPFLPALLPSPPSFPHQSFFPPWADTTGCPQHRPEYIQFPLFFHVLHVTFDPFWCISRRNIPEHLSGSRTQRPQSSGISWPWENISPNAFLHVQMPSYKEHFSEELLMLLVRHVSLWSESSLPQCLCSVRAQLTSSSAVRCGKKTSASSSVACNLLLHSTSMATHVAYCSTTWRYFMFSHNSCFQIFFYPLYLAGHHPTLHYMLVIYPVCTLTLLFHTHTSSMIYCQWRLVEEVLASRAKPHIFFTAIVWDQWSIATHKLDLIVSDLSPTNPLLSCLPSFNSSSLPFLYGFWFLISLNLLRRNFNL